MQSADALPPMRDVYENLHRILATADSDHTLLTTAQAAHDLARVDGMYVLFRNGADALVLTAGDGSVLSKQAGALRKSIGASKQTEVRRHATDCRLPDGRRIKADISFNTAPPEGTPTEALGFFWCESPVAQDGQLRSLPAVAFACSVALQRNEQMRLDRKHNRALLTELQHRTRNLLALLRSIIRRSGALAGSAEEFGFHLEARVSALARTQSVLALDGDTAPELEDLLRTELTANAIRDRQFTIQGPSVRLSSRATETMALAMHELTTNALKFGALTAAGGHIAVSWWLDQQPPTLHWRWLESGVAVAQLTPQHRGFGQELIERMLPYELGAQTEFALAPGGLRCVIRLPLDDRTVAPVERNRWRIS